MASVFTYQEDVKRIHSPWSTPGNTTPQGRAPDDAPIELKQDLNTITRLEPEKQDGPCEYKLHLLLRARRKFASMTTATNATSYLHARGSPSMSSGTSPSDLSFQRSTYQPSPQTRQARLQQLTTQLLWRLQQSSPFHSSSNSQLILPVLPEATPRLDVPERPSKLLPGLEESQGALYELGVADDGALVGLVEDELEESLNNLRAMAASLGCVCDVLLKVAVGNCRWEAVVDQDGSTTSNMGQLFVAEVLVRPDSGAISETVSASHLNSGFPLVQTVSTTTVAGKASVEAEQVRIAFVGASTAGKSSLVGTITTSMLDNGRGKSRLSLLKHRHEIASGVTSSVAHELIGYKLDAADAEDFVVNYAAGDVSSWTDIHNLSSRLCFLIDSPGLPRYAKSIFRSLLSWDPHWAVLCIAADEHDGSSAGNGLSSSADQALVSDNSAKSEMSLAHLSLCLRLDLSIVVVITKMDLATKVGLRPVLGKVLSALKAAGRHPMLMSTPSTPIPTFALDSNQALPDLRQISFVEQEEITGVVNLIQRSSSSGVVPIVLSSAVSGSGIGKLHSLFSRLPIIHPASSGSGMGQVTHAIPSVLFHVDEVFTIPPSRVYSADPATQLDAQGSVLCGRLDRGQIAVGDQIMLGPFLSDDVSTKATIPRSKSYSAQDIRRALKPGPASVPQSLEEDGRSANAIGAAAKAIFVPVRVVSLRNLRLPLLGLQQGETGTIGIEVKHGPDAEISLSKARKGMVLLGPRHVLDACRSFTAVFSTADFIGSSPPLLLGGHAIAYINSIRAAVKVTAQALADEGTEPSSPTEVFAFDGDDEDDHRMLERGQKGPEKQIKITFRLGSTMEWMEVGGQVLVVPTVSATGPVAGPVATTNNLEGFVGRVCDVHT